MNNCDNKTNSDITSSNENSWSNSSAEGSFSKTIWDENKTIWDEKSNNQGNNITPRTVDNGTTYEENSYQQANGYAGDNNQNYNPNYSQNYNQNYNNFNTHNPQNINNNGYYNNYNGNYNQNGYGYNSNYNDSYNQNGYNGNYNDSYNQNGYNGNYNGSYNQNGYNYNGNYNQNSYNYNGAGDYNSAPDRYTYNHQKKFFGGKFQYPIPYTANTVCVEPKRDKLVTKLIIALMLTMPIGILLVILSYVLAVVFLTDVFINIAMALISVAFVGILVSLVVILTLGPVMEAISKKRHCKLKLTGVIRDVRYDKTSKGSRTFIPLYSYAYMGKEYYFEGAESMFEKFEIGSEIEVYINEADPTQQYVPDEQKSIAIYHLVIIGLILLAFLITGIAAYCDFH